MKYPIGIQNFDKIINDNYVYVDKTDLIYKLVTEGTIYFLGRPRRFGKSLLVSTLEHYFLGHKELFKGLKIDSLEKDWLEYPVFHIDFSGDNYVSAGLLEEKIERYTGSNTPCSTSTLAATIMYPPACWKKKSNATWQLGRKPTAATRHGKA